MAGGRSDGHGPIRNSLIVGVRGMLLKFKNAFCEKRAKIKNPKKRESCRCPKSRGVLGIDSVPDPGNIRMRWLGEKPVDQIKRAA